MYSYGLECFLQAKKLSSKETLTKFLEHEGVTNFTYKNHNRINTYIQNNWVKFASFVDNGIKTGILKGKAVKLNSYFDQEKEYNNIKKMEIETLSKEVIDFGKFISKYDDLRSLGRLRNFCIKYEIPLPKRIEGNSNLFKASPILQEVINHSQKEECMQYIKNKYENKCSKV